MSDAEWEDAEMIEASESEYEDDDDEAFDDEEDDDSDFEGGKSKKKGKGKKAAAKKAPAAKAPKKAAAKSKGTPASTPAGKENSTPAKPKAAPKRKAAAVIDDDDDGEDEKPVAKKAKAAPKEKGEKVVNVSGKEAEQMVLDYMLSQNRPYSIIQIFDNLHKAVKKANLQKILDKLVEGKKLQEFTFNKTKLYIADQSQYPPLDQKELDAMDEQIEDLSAELADRKQEAKMLQNEIAALETQPTNEDADRLIAQLNAEMEAKTNKLHKLSTEVTLISTEEITKIKTKLKNTLKIWRQRRGIAKDMVDAALGEESEQTPQQFQAEIGIETDEDAGVSLQTVTKMLD